MSEPKSERDLFMEEFVDTFDPQFRLTPPEQSLALSAWSQRALIARKELAAKDAIIAELVRLLERGKALYVAGRGSGSFRQQGCVDDARVDEATAGLILADYDAAVAKHGRTE